MLVRLIWVLILITTFISCGKIENQFTKVVSSDELVVTHVFCSTLLGIPVFCTFEENRTVYVHVETVVTEIVETIVLEEIIKEVIIEMIVTEIETVYISTEVEISAIVIVVVERVKELVPEDELIDVPLNEIVEEVTNEFIDKIDE